MKQRAIFGTGGFALQIADMAADQSDQIVFVSDEGGVFLGGRTITPNELDPNTPLVIAIASGDTRQRIVKRLPNPAWSLLARTATISRWATIDDGAIICGNSIIEAKASIGKQFHANTFCFIAHECQIGDYVTFAPGVRCNGAVKIGDGAYIGTGALIRQGLTIGAGAVVGMGAVVTKDVEQGAVVVGNPARAR